MVLEELLAPAGSPEVLTIAVNAGADAVYIAGQNYGARAYAKNFTMEEIKKAVNYAHMNGAKIHVTVNTLINNFEIVDVLNYLFELYRIGVDAVIVQDFGLIWLLKTFIPDLEVHASTQMGINNYSSIKWAYKNNIKRIVLPREVNIEQIRQTSEQLEKDNINMDLEVFGHGALCYCVSGKCYMSSYNSGRSGNRGACAQPCRREYRLKYRGYNIGNGYLLSTHDLATYDHLQEISDAGVKSLKLEGRMKSGDYIGTIVNSYRNLLDGNEGDYKKDLHLVFNRHFTNGYMMGDGTTFYFAAKGKESIGGYDIFVTRYDAENARYLKPENIGLPFNSKADDYMYVEDDMNKLAWFVTSRNQPEGKVCVYTIVPSENRVNYDMSNIDDSRLEQLAAISRIRDTWPSTAKRNQAMKRLNDLKNDAGGITDESIYFPINDYLVYRSLGEFQSIESRTLFERLQSLQTEVKKEIHHLDLIRKEYRKTSGDTHKRLAEDIIDYERIIERQQNEIKVISKQIRNVENQAIN